METTPTRLEELITRLRELTDKRETYIECFGSELYNDRYDKSVRELLDRTETLVKSQTEMKERQSIVPKVVVLAKLWPMLSPELRLLLLTVAKLPQQESTEAALQNLCRWLLGSEGAEIPLFIEVLQEVHRQQVPIAEKKTETKQNLNDDVPKLVYADHDSVMVAVKTIGEATTSVELNRSHFGGKKYESTAKEEKTSPVRVAEPNIISARPFGETVSSAELNRFHFGNNSHSGGFDRMTELLSHCPPVKIPKAKSQTYVERIKCQISVTTDGVEKCCNSKAVMTFPQKHSAVPIATCNYHKKFVLQNNPRNPKTGECLIDESTPAKLYVEKKTEEKKTEVHSCEYFVDPGMCPEVKDLLTTKIGVTLCPKHVGLVNRPGLTVIKEEMERCQMTIERSGPMGERKRDERCSNKATKSFPGMTDSPNDSIEVCARHDHMIRAFNRLDPATGRYKIDYDTTIKLYRYDEDWDSKLPCEFTVKIHDGTILGCQHHGDFPAGNGKHYCKHHSWLITVNGLKACQPPTK